MPTSQQNTGTQTTTSSQPGINDVLGTAKTIFNNGSAWAPYTASQVSPFAQQTTAGLTGMQQVAGQSTQPFAQQFNRVNQSLQGLGTNGLTNMQDTQVGRLEGIASGNGLNAEQQSAYDYLNPIARGDYMQGNPYLDELIGRTSQDIGNSSNMMASAAGRYGSGAHQGVLNDAIGDMSAKLRYQNYGDEASRRDNAINSLFGMGTTGNNQRTDAIGSLYNAGQQGLNNIQGGTQAMQDAYDARLSPYQTMLGVGSAYEGKNQQVLNDARRVFDETKLSQTNPIDWLNGLARGYQGGTQMTQGFQNTNPWAQGIGGGLSAYGATGNPFLAMLGGAGGFLS